MSVLFDLTVTGPEILDSVIFMEKSPAHAAFKEELGKILSDFNKTSKFGSNVEIDVNGLIESSAETIRNMHRAFLIWTFHEDLTNGAKTMRYNTYLKLFFKGQEKRLVSLNGGSKSIAPENAAPFRDKYIEEVSKDPDLFNGLKEFFAGYVYGYFFNYLNEQTVMKDYAEFLVCLGIMSNKITTTESAKQKILPKMAMLLNNDRFKYISGEIPLEIMMEQIYYRFNFTELTPDEDTTVKEALKGYVIDEYSYNESDDLVVDDVMADAMSRFNKFICSKDFANNLYVNTFDGVRTFLDEDKDDVGDFTVERLTDITNEKCSVNHDSYYTAGREPVLEFALSADMKGYKYPLTFNDEGTYWFTDIYKVILAPACDKAIYIEVEEEDLPLRMFPFAEPALNTNIIRTLGNLESKSYSIRSDKRHYLVEMNALPASKTLSEDDKKMQALEKLLYIISGNMNTDSYKKLIEENVFGTKLYEDYIRYRMDCLFSKGMKSLEAKKTLLDELNKIG